MIPLVTFRASQRDIPEAPRTRGKVACQTLCWATKASDVKQVLTWHDCWRRYLATKKEGQFNIVNDTNIHEWHGLKLFAVVNITSLTLATFTWRKKKSHVYCGQRKESFFPSGIFHVIQNEPEAFLPPHNCGMIWVTYQGKIWSKIAPLKALQGNVGWKMCCYMSNKDHMLPLDGLDLQRRWEHIPW